MGELVRFGIAVDEELLRKFDKLTVARGYANRSEALRDLMRDALVQQQWQANEEVVGVITLLYDHHARNLEAQLTDIQHEHHGQILSTMHIHLDHNNCLEIIAVRGTGRQIEELATKLIGMKGVRHGKLTATSTGRGLH
ncbi:MAG: nickel-responsive transcriptional regulator NikR [Candidatus Bipolaricaulota bacterium]|nr:nickel-responsive transcriptional regulator NikR [Candidatus Bipolaricaulota bacterium]MDW8031620.1 nickel-responsive transcriptional regulator NikR [Candidatus Bipolaricaulota bacterium]